VRWPGWLAVFVAVAACATAIADDLVPYRVEGDAIREPLASLRGDAARGKQVVASRDSNCLLCHAVPDSGVRAMGDIGPPLNGVGVRFSEGQLRLRIVDSMRLNRDTIMPSYYRMDGLNRVGEAWRGKPVLTAQQVEDIVAYLLTLR
jgi:sulfur-oxidizing protein SoxX